MVCVLSVAGDFLELTYMNNVALLMGLYPQSVYNDIVSSSKTMPQYAADALQKAFVSGISNYCNIEVFNLPYVGSFPKRYKQLFVPTAEHNAHNLKIHSFRYCNLIGYKYLSRIIVAYKNLSKWIQQNPNNRSIVIYALDPSFLLTMVLLKKRWPDLKVLQVVPDLPEYMGSKQTKFRVAIQEKFKKAYELIDGWILLSKYMADRLNITSKPWNVIEGIYNSDNKVVIRGECNAFRIFYAGTLAQRYGILNLVNAVANSSLSNLELVICGDGDSYGRILDISKKDSRIKVLGAVPREKVLEHMQNANLLVNPRTNEGEYTKYSFPSKTMEYLASGVPTLLYVLPGIPAEYYNYCFSLTTNGVDVLQKEIERIALLPQKQLYELGVRARKFILEEKNPEKQCEKLYDILKKIEC